MTASSSDSSSVTTRPTASKSAAGDLHVVFGGVGSGGDGGGAGQADRGRVRHRADDARARGEARFDRGDGDAGGDRDHDRPLFHLAPDRGEDLVDDLRLHREDEHVHLADERVVVGRRPDAVRRLELLQPLGLDVARDDPRRGDRAGVEEPFDERAGHVARAEESEGARLHRGGHTVREGGAGRKLAHRAPV